MNSEEEVIGVSSQGNVLTWKPQLFSRWLTRHQTQEMVEVLEEMNETKLSGGGIKCELSDDQSKRIPEPTGEEQKNPKRNKRQFDRMRQRVFRANESEDQKARRRELDRNRRAIARKKESESKRRIRLEKDRERQRLAREAETESQRELRLEKDRVRKAAKRTSNSQGRKRRRPDNLGESNGRQK